MMILSPCRIIRHCVKSVVINGVTIPKGVTVTVPVQLLHNDPKYWRDPDVFDPERYYFLCECIHSSPLVCSLSGFHQRRRPSDLLCVTYHLAMGQGVA